MHFIQVFTAALQVKCCFTDIPFTPDMVVIGILLSSVSQATDDVRRDGTTG